MGPSRRLLAIAAVAGGLLVGACQPPKPPPPSPSPLPSPSPQPSPPPQSPSPPVASATQRASVDSAGAQGDDVSYGPAISADGRYAAFASWASNLVADDANAAGDVFVHDRQTGTTERVSVASDGSEGDADSWEPTISADGRHVAFSSWASNLVADDTNGTFDVFVHDRQTGTTERVSVDSSGTEGNGGSWEPAISADGSAVAFSSLGNNLVPDDTNEAPDVFVRTRLAGTTERVSVGPAGAEGDGGSFEPAISADGDAVAFASAADNLVPDDANGFTDVFVRTRQAGTTERVSVGPAGAEGDDTSWEPVISADGRHVAFSSVADNLVEVDTNGASDVFVRDRQAGATTRVSVDSAGAQANSHSDEPAISADGRHVAFASVATNLVSGDTGGFEDVFVRDRQAGTTERVSLDSGGSPGNSHSWEPAMSADGRHVAFSSVASNLVPGDTNLVSDVFVRDRDS